MTYSTNTLTRKRVDALLRMNASVRANLGTKTPLDVGTEQEADKVWIQLLLQIRSIDPDFYLSIASDEEKEMISQKIYSKRQFRELDQP